MTKTQKVEPDTPDIIDFADEGGDEAVSEHYEFDQQEEVESADSDADFIRDKTRSNNRKKKRSGGFQAMGLSASVLNAVLKKGYKIPTPIQRKAVPVLLAGNDIVAMARTGSGKTAAFIIPMLDKLKSHTTKVGARALILSPSRELAMQTCKFARELGKYTDLRCATIVGGDQMDEQFEMMATNPDIIIATPGRLLHLIVEMQLELKTVEYLVFDEADRLFELGFAESLREIMFRLSPSRQTCLFSATLPKSLVEFAKAGLQSPKLVRLDVDNKISPDLQLAFFPVRHIDKDGALIYLLRNVINSEHQSIIFASTKHHVDYLHELLLSLDIDNSFIYGALDMTARKINLAKFRAGKTKYLIVTDVAARGIDIPFLNNVIHYDFTDKSKLFVHRSGRAARAGRTGTAYAFVTNEELPYLIDLHLFLGRQFLLSSQLEKHGSASSLSTDIVFGDIPHSLYIEYSTTVNETLASNAGLASLRKVADNGYKLYTKTRAQSSRESIIRAKQLLEHSPKGSASLGVHPVFADKLTAEELNTNVLDQIRQFRPQETIFEIKKMGLKLGAANDVMKLRRGIVGQVIEKKRAQKTNFIFGDSKSGSKREIEDVDDDVLESVFGTTGKRPTKTIKLEETGSFRDSEFYVAAAPSDAAVEKQYAINDNNFARDAANAQMDLTAEDTDLMRKSNSAMKWDKKKGQYVKTTIGADNKKMLKSESGALLPNSFKTNAFDKWKKKKNVRSLRVGEEEAQGIATNVNTSLSGKGPRKFRHTSTKDAKPLDKYAVDYERKLRKQHGKMKTALSGNHPAIDAASAHSRMQKQRGVRDELKDGDTIRKERKVQEKRREKNARAPRSTKKKGNRLSGSFAKKKSSKKSSGGGGGGKKRR